MCSSEGGDGLVDCEGVFYAEDSATAALERVEMGSGAEGFSEVAGECADVGAFAAGHADGSAWQSESRVVGHIDSAGCSASFQCFALACGESGNGCSDVRFAHPTTALRFAARCKGPLDRLLIARDPRFRAAGGTVLTNRFPLSYR